MNKLLNKYIEVRKRTEEICVPLSIEDYIPQAVEFTSPPKWHLAHTTWFFERMILSKYVNNYVDYNTEYNFLFNSYYNNIGKRVERNQRGMITKPSVDDIYKYRMHIDEHISKLLSETMSDEVKQLLILGLNHEQQHQELLLTDLKYSFSLNPIFPVYDVKSNLVKDYNESTGWLKITEGVYEIGHATDEFSFDNELGKHKVYLHEFEISKALVTNGEFIDFIDDGGYDDFNFWLDDGWSWIRNENINAPYYWHKIDGEWFYYTLAGLLPVDNESILSHISFYEANAFATWKGCRLPTEFEWETASKKIDWGKRWEWTNSAYLPYPGFKIAVGAVGEYNGKFMINQMVLRGGSVATSIGHSRSTYRNFFQPHFQWQFTGIRLTN